MAGVAAFYKGNRKRFHRNRFFETESLTIKRPIRERFLSAIRGIVTFVSGNGIVEYMHLFTADGFEGEMHACDEGELAWVDRDRITDLNIWEGDKIFLRLLREETPFFSLKLVYDGGSRLVSASLDGKKLAL